MSVNFKVVKFGAERTMNYTFFRANGVGNGVDLSLVRGRRCDGAVVEARWELHTSDSDYSHHHTYPYLEIETHLEASAPDALTLSIMVASVRDYWVKLETWLDDELRKFDAFGTANRYYSCRLYDWDQLVRLNRELDFAVMTSL